MLFKEIFHWAIMKKLLNQSITKVCEEIYKQYYIGNALNRLISQKKLLVLVTKVVLVPNESKP